GWNSCVKALLLGWCAAITLGCAVGTTTQGTQPSRVSRGSHRDPVAMHGAQSSEDAADFELSSDDAELLSAYSECGASDRQSGKATYYADSLAGHRMANGKRYDPKRLTAAHRKLPFGTVVRVVRESNGAEVTVRVTDRGPFGASDRIIDLSRKAAQRLGMLRAGVVDVHLFVIGVPNAANSRIGCQRK
ncbi:MAG TPA: septal ring lytic transglycosylase RlpA family protein, partial [Polyangiaceae bacterium]